MAEINLYRLALRLSHAHVTPKFDALQEVTRHFQFYWSSYDLANLKWKYTRGFKASVAQQRDVRDVGTGKRCETGPFAEKITLNVFFFDLAFVVNGRDSIFVTL